MTIEHTKEGVAGAVLHVHNRNVSVLVVLAPPGDGGVAEANLFTLFVLGVVVYGARLSRSHVSSSFIYI